MNPHQKNKIDVKSLSPEEQRLLRLYGTGKLPSKSDHFAKHLKERKYFDSGDYAMSKAGKGNSVDTGSIGSQHPVPENIPHLSSPSAHNGGPAGAGHHPSLRPDAAAAAQGVGQPGGAAAGSPVKEGSYLHRETSASEADAGQKDGEENNAPADDAGSQTIPIRR